MAYGLHVSTDATTGTSGATIAGDISISDGTTITATEVALGRYAKKEIKMLGKVCELLLKQPVTDDYDKETVEFAKNFLVTHKDILKPRHKIKTNKAKAKQWLKDVQEDEDPRLVNPLHTYDNSRYSLNFWTQEYIPYLFLGGTNTRVKPKVIARTKKDKKQAKILDEVMNYQWSKR